MASELQIQTAMPASLEDVLIKSLPPSAFYIADFISVEEEQILLNRIETTPKPRWKQLSHRRLQSWPSELVTDLLLEGPLPSWLVDPVIPRILSSTFREEHIFACSPHSEPNHVLINEYLPGQGIMPHKDGTAYHPVVCTVSLGGSTCLDIYSSNDDGARETEPRWKILQEPRSLLIITDEIYTEHMHGIQDTSDDTNLSEATVANWSLLGSTKAVVDGRSERLTRTSLTYRDVKRVSKLGKKFGLFGKR